MEYINNAKTYIIIVAVIILVIEVCLILFNLERLTNISVLFSFS